MYLLLNIDPVSYGILNPMVNRPQVQFIMGFKIPYDTGTSGFWGEDGHKTTNTNWFGQ